MKNNIVYVAGSEYNTNGKQVAKYWKNGVQKILSDGIEHSKITSLAISNNTIYSIGYNYLNANLWIGDNIQLSNYNNYFSSIIVR